MKKAMNQNFKMVDIIESVSTDTYHCPVCKKELIRNFGAIKQFYSHEKNVDATDCEIKMKLIIKEDKSIFQQSDTDILSTEFYNKQFDDVEVEMSDYMLRYRLLRGVVKVRLCITMPKSILLAKFYIWCITSQCS